MVAGHGLVVRDQGGGHSPSHRLEHSSHPAIQDPAGENPALQRSVDGHSQGRRGVALSECRGVVRAIAARGLLAAVAVVFPQLSPQFLSRDLAPEGGPQLAGME